MNYSYLTETAKPGKQNEQPKINADENANDEDEDEDDLLLTQALDNHTTQQSAIIFGKNGNSNNTLTISSSGGASSSHLPSLTDNSIASKKLTSTKLVRK